jgi:serine/threonine protein kinase
MDILSIKLYMIWCITMGMEKLHANELLHRDFKTSNILIGVLGLDTSKDKVVPMLKKMNDKCVKCGEHEWMERKS